MKKEEGCQTMTRGIFLGQLTPGFFGKFREVKARLAYPDLSMMPEGPLDQSLK